MSFSFPPPSTRIVIKTSQGSTLRFNITVTPLNCELVPEVKNAVFSESLRHARQPFASCPVHVRELLGAKEHGPDVVLHGYELEWEQSKRTSFGYCDTLQAAFAVAYPSQDLAVPSYQLSNIFVYDGNMQVGPTLLGT